MDRESGETNRLLAEILAAIQSLDRHLKAHEKRINSLETAGKIGEGLGVPDGGLLPPLSSPKSQGAEDDTVEHSISPYPGPISTTCKEERKYWTEQIGDAWILPLDYRIDLGFQEPLLDKLSAYDLKLRLEQLQMFNDNLLGSKTPLRPKSTARRNWFRHLTIEDTLPNPPFHAQSYTIGRLESRSFHKSSEGAISDASKRRGSLSVLHTDRLGGFDAASHTYGNAPWQRIM
ncbi:MAG: hypothetical protein Q9163_000147 [Psora crenata]